MFAFGVKALPRPLCGAIFRFCCVCWARFSSCAAGSSSHESRPDMVAVALWIASAGRLQRKKKKAHQPFALFELFPGQSVFGLRFSASFEIAW